MIRTVQGPLYASTARHTRARRSREGVECGTLPRNVIRLFATDRTRYTVYRVGVRLRKLTRSVRRRAIYDVFCLRNNVRSGPTSLNAATHKSCILRCQLIRWHCVTCPSWTRCFFIMAYNQKLNFLIRAWIPKVLDIDCVLLYRLIEIRIN